MQYHSLGRIYEEIKDDIGYFVRLYTSAKVARMGVEQVVNLLEIANNDLPLVEHKCERLKREVIDIEADKHNSARIFQELTDQISTMRKRLDSINKDCEEETTRLQDLQQQRMKQEAIVRQFGNNNEEYIKIRKTVEEKVHSFLSDAKPLLRLALLSIIESIRSQPDKYSPLIYSNKSSTSTSTSTIEYSSQYCSAASYGQQQQYQPQDYRDMLIEEAEKLYNKLAKEWIGEIIIDSSSILSSSLPVLSPSDEKEQSHPSQTTAANQSHMHVAEHRFVQSEIDSEDQR